MPPQKRTFPPGATHPILAGAREVFATSTPNDTGHLRPTKRKLVDVLVGKDQPERALEFLDALFEALERPGHRVDLAPSRRNFPRSAVDVREAPKRQYHWFRDWSPDRPTVTYVGSIAFRFGGGRCEVPERQVRSAQRPSSPWSSGTRSTTSPTSRTI